MATRKQSSRGGFTLVEMLVVIAIIVLLAAILIPTANVAIRAARQASNGVEIADVMSAIERYRSENGGIYPPSFGEDYTTPTNTRLYRYLLKAYPKISNRDITYMMTQVAPRMDQSAALHFWLTQTSANPRYPFTDSNKRSYFAMDERRLTPLAIVPADTNDPPAYPALQLYGYRPRNAGESMYVYIEASHYPLHVNGALNSDQSSGTNLAAGSGTSRPPETSVRPFLKLNLADLTASNLNNYVNSDTFQLHCAGLDGRFCVNHDRLRKFPSGEEGITPGTAVGDGDPIDYDLFKDDLDNQTNFSDGQAISSVSAIQ